MANLRTFDLNLLVMLEALISERHVTRAAKRLGVTQPAMTSALNRVRAIFDDPLLVRTPAGMVPTPKALELLGPTREILRSIDHILDRQKHFDPLTSTRSFRVRVSGLMSAILLPDVVGRFRNLAPNARFEAVSLSPTEIVPYLEGGDLDLALSMGIDHNGAVEEMAILDDEFVFAFGSHQDESGSVSLVGSHYLKIAQGQFDTAFTDGILKELGAERNVSIKTMDWLTAGPVLEATDLVLVSSRRFAEFTAQRYDIKIAELPIPTPFITWCAYWHRRNSADEALCWLRDLIAACCAEIGAARTIRSL